MPGLQAIRTLSILGVYSNLKAIRQRVTLTNTQETIMYSIMFTRLGCLVFGLALLLSGCGSGGDDAPATPVAQADLGTAEGNWTGSTNETDRTLATTVLDDGAYYVIYSLPSNPSVVSGVVHGTGTSENGVFTSANAKDFNFDDVSVLSATISATYTARQWFSGSIAYPGLGAFTFNHAFNAGYDTEPLLATLVGSYQGTARHVGSQISTMAVQVWPDGRIGSAVAVPAGTSDPNVCPFGGTVTPRAHGNVFDVSITTAVPGCFFGNSTATGIAYLTTAGVVILATDRSNMLLFVGTKE